MNNVAKKASVGGHDEPLTEQIERLEKPCWRIVALVTPGPRKCRQLDAFLMFFLCYCEGRCHEFKLTDLHQVT